MDSKKDRVNFVSATQKAMDLLARRDHSALELRRKLHQRGYEESEIEKALEYVQTQGWLRPAQELSEAFSSQLSRRNKSQRQINANLASKGLPTLKADPEQELEKALRLVENRTFIVDDLNFEEKQKLKAKLARQLQSRGFSSEVIGKVLNEKFPS